MTSGIPTPPDEMNTLKTKVLEYFKKTPGGTFTAACKAAGLPYSTGHDWRRDDEQFNRDVIEARKAADDIGGDFAESKLMEAINNNELTGIIFYLKTKHKNRGYTERHDVGHGFAPEATETDKDIIARALALMSKRGDD